MAQALADQLGFDRFVVLRKSVKPYMQHPRQIPVVAITTPTPQQLVLDGQDTAWLAQKRCLLIDDVISTGGSMVAAHTLVTAAGGQVVGQAAILAEGAAAKREDVIFLAALPLFSAETGLPLTQKNG